MVSKKFSPLKVYLYKYINKNNKLVTFLVNICYSFLLWYTFLELNYYSNFSYANNPVFIRGGRCISDIASTGFYYFNQAAGSNDTYGSFRPVLATLWYNKFFLTY